MSDERQRDSHDDVGPGLVPDEWSHRIREAYRAPSLSRSRQAAFDLALRERISEQGSGPWGFSFAHGLGAAAAMAAAVALLWLMLPGGPVEDISPEATAPSLVAEAPLEPSAGGVDEMPPRVLPAPAEEVAIAQGESQ